MLLVCRFAVDRLASGTIPEVSGTIPEVSGTIPVSCTIPEAFDRILGAFGRIPVVSGTFPEAFDKFPEVSGTIPAACTILEVSGKSLVVDKATKNIEFELDFILWFILKRCYLLSFCLQYTQ